MGKLIHKLERGILSDVPGIVLTADLVIGDHNEFSTDIIADLGETVLMADCQRVGYGVCYPEAVVRQQIEVM